MNLTRSILHQFDPERVHDLAICGCLLASKVPCMADVLGALFSFEDSRLNVSVGNLSFPNPIGLAAGFDKDGVAIPALQALGFGFIEVGTVTPEPQPGNQKPRLFRLKRECAVINRMGFNNKGIDHLVARLNGVQRKVPLGINLGKNKHTSFANTASDYQTGLSRAWEFGDYFTINISSPNTENLRNLQLAENLEPFIQSVIATRDRLASASKRYKQVWLKIAPDLTDNEIQQICNIVLESGVDAMVVSNTTISRPVRNKTLASEQGGLSGKPLLKLSNEVLAKVKKITQDKVPVVGVGGIFSVEDIQSKLSLGADLVQLYTGFVFNGPGFVKKLKRELLERLD